MKKVLIISYYWPPAGGAGVQRWLKLSKYLSRSGVETHVLTVDPNLASYPVRDLSLLNEIGSKVLIHHSSTREWFGAYSKISGRKKIPMAGFAGEEKPSALQMLARFLRGNLFIPDPRRGWNKFALKEAFKIIAENNIKTVITTGPPHSTHLLGLKIKSKCKVQWIADFRDPWTDIYYYKQFLHLPPAVALDRYYEKTVLEKSDRVIVISNDMKRLFLGKSNLLKQNSIHVLPNGYDDADFEKVTPAAPKKSPSLVYTGTLTPSYPLSSILEALKKSNGFKPLQLEFIGSVSHPALTQLPDISGISVSILPHIPHHDSVSAIAGASCLLFLIPETSSYKVLPGKLFEYIRSGPPILGIGPTDGDAAAILSDTGAGKMFAPQDIEGIEDYLKQILQGIVPKRNANVISSFSREAQADELLSWVV